MAYGGQRELWPEADKMFRVDHGQGTSEGSQVNQQVEVNIDSGGGDGSVDDLLLSP